MDKDIRQYLHYYIGAVRCRHRYVDYAPSQWTVWINLTPSRYHGLMDDRSISDIEIELRKLESMTEEEKKHIGFEAYNVLRDAKKLPAFQEGKIWAAHQTHYLLSKGFDLFGLIDAGLAINKETLTP